MSKPKSLSTVALAVFRFAVCRWRLSLVSSKRELDSTLRFFHMALIYIHMNGAHRGRLLPKFQLCQWLDRARESKYLRYDFLIIARESIKRGEIWRFKAVYLQIRSKYWIINSSLSSPSWRIQFVFLFQFCWLCVHLRAELKSFQNPQLQNKNGKSCSISWLVWSSL